LVRVGRRRKSLKQVTLVRSRECLSSGVHAPGDWKRVLPLDRLDDVRVQTAIGVADEERLLHLGRTSGRPATKRRTECDQRATPDGEHYGF
jgi:hypothetical protein